ncbi:MAG: DUF438 domain-containing protein [Candidatus Sulfopaludibacter sp.]|nr:DUF438 domain-containing protein [Candidatus Sulfopaludibacter sp.]
MSELIDNRAQRVRTLKGIIQRLHAGEAPDDVRSSLKELVCRTDYSEVMAMEQELIADGMPVEEIQSMCDLHSQVTREVLVQLAPPPLPPGHPVDTLRRENEALRDSMTRLQQAMNRVLETPDDGDASAPLLAWRQALNELQDVDKHYQRKEHLLFTCLERHGITGPSKVMWGKDDQIRELLKGLGAALRERDTAVAEWKLLAATMGAAAVSAVHEMIYKEEQILLPICLERFTADEWAEIWASSPRYGWCLVAPREGYKPVDLAPDRASAAGGVSLPTGTLTLEQLIAIFSTLPVDLTFVDASDRVAFFSEGPNRVFARSRAIIGRMVQNCHPPRSVDVVERILGDFRAGRQNVAEFWIQFMGRFVHIRYFAVRGGEGRYLGTLEVTQDAGPIRALEGERRLLEYGVPAAAGAQ